MKRFVLGIVCVLGAFGAWSCASVNDISDEQQAYELLGPQRPPGCVVTTLENGNTCTCCNDGGEFAPTVPGGTTQRVCCKCAGPVACF